MKRTVDVTVWLNFLMQSALMAAVASVAFGGLVGYALASLGSIPVWVGIVVGALVPVVGLLVLAIIAMARHKRQAPTPGELWWIRSRAGRVFTAALGVLAVVLFASMFLGWFKLRIAGIPAMSVGAWGTAIGAVLVISLLVVGVAAVLGTRRPTRMGAVLMGWFGCWWIFISVVAISLQAPAVALASSVGALKYTVGDVTKLLNLKTGVGEVQLPDGVDPAWLGLESSSLDLSAVDLAQAIPDLSFSTGPGWWLALTFGIGALVWSFGMVNRASARTRATAKIGRSVAPVTRDAPAALPQAVPAQAFQPLQPHSQVQPQWRTQPQQLQGSGQPVPYNPAQPYSPPQPYNPTELNSPQQPQNGQRNYWEQ